MKANGPVTVKQISELTSIPFGKVMDETRELMLSGHVGWQSGSKGTLYAKGN